MKKQFALLILCSLFLVGAVSAQDTDDDAPIKVDTLLLTMPVTVSDGGGRNIAGLKKENFTIFQDGFKQDIEYFFNEEAPMNVALLIDTSASTKQALDKIQKAARDFVRVLRPEDKGIVVAFDYRTAFLSEFTPDKKKLSKAIDQAAVNEDQAGSDVNDAILQIVNKYFASFKGRKAIVALTDGMVTKRQVSSQQAMDALRQSDTLFYPIIFKTKSYSEASARALRNKQRKPMAIEILEIMAQETAGRIYEKDAANLKEAFQSIAEELKNQYLIGFYPQATDHKNPADRIKIEVDRKDFRVRTKKRWSF